VRRGGARLLFLLSVDSSVALPGSRPDRGGPAGRDTGCASRRRRYRPGM